MESIATTLPALRDPVGLDATPVRLVFRPHPFASQRLDSIFPPGLSILEILTRAFDQHGVIPCGYARLAVFIDGVPVAPEDAEVLIPRAGALVSATFVPEYAGLLFIGKVILVAIISAAVSLGIQALIGTPEQDNLDENDPNTSPTIQGARNQIMAGRAIWRPFGKHRITPPIIARPFTETRGGDQFLNMMFGWYGPTEIDNIKIGDGLLWTKAGGLTNNFQEVEIEVKEGDDADTPVTLITDSVAEDRPNFGFPITLNPSAPSVHTFSDLADKLSIELFFSQGLKRFDGKSGGGRNSNLDLSVTFRKVGDTTWLHAAQQPGLGFSAGRSVTVTVPFNTDFHLDAQTVEQFSFGVEWTVPTRDAYEIRVIRGGLGNTPAQLPSSAGGTGKDASAVTGDATWTIARAILFEDPVTFKPRLAKIAVRIRATDQFRGFIDQLNCEVYSKVPTWTSGGGWTAPVKSRNPAWHALEILRGQANRDPVADTQLDLPMFKTLADSCLIVPATGEAEGNYRRTFDAVIDFEATTKEHLDAALSAGRAAAIVVDDQITVQIDEAKTVPVQNLSLRNTTSFSATRRNPDIPDALVVEFRNEDEGWQQEERSVYNDTFSAGDADSGAILMNVTTGDTFTRFTGDFRLDGFKAGGFLVASGFAQGANNAQHLMETVTQFTIQVAGGGLMNESGTGDERLVTTGAVKTDRLRLWGKTRPTEIWTEGRKRLAEVKLRPESYQMEMDWEHLVAVPGDLIRATDDVTLWGLAAGRIKEMTTTGPGDVTEIRYDEDAAVAPPDTYAARIRKSDGTNLVQTIDEAATALKQITTGDNGWMVFDTAIPVASAPAIGDLVQYGIEGKETQDLIIASIEPAGELRARVTLVDSGVTPTGSIFDVDNEAIPTFSSGINLPQELDRMLPPTPTIEGVRIEARGTGEDGTPLLFLLAFVVAGTGSGFTEAFQGQWQLNDPDVKVWLHVAQVPADENVVVFGPLKTTANIDIRIRAVSPAGAVSPWVFANNNGLVGPAVAPSNVTITAKTASTPEGAFPFLLVAWELVGDAQRITLAFHLRWRIDGGPWNVVPQIQIFPDKFLYEIAATRIGLYEIEVSSIGLDGTRSVATAASFDFRPSAAFKLLRPSGLEIEGQGNDETYAGTEVALAWRVSSALLDSELGSEILGGDSSTASAGDTTLKDFELRFIDPATGDVLSVRHSERNRFLYTRMMMLDDAAKLGRTEPLRTIRIGVAMRDRWNQISQFTFLPITNPAPGIVRSIVLDPHFNALGISWEGGDEDPDHLGYLVWGETVAGFDPLTTAPKVQTPAKLAVIQTAVNTTLYVRIAAFDNFSRNPSDLSISNEFTATTPRIQTGDAEPMAFTAFGHSTETLDVEIFDGTGTDEDKWMDVDQVPLNVFGGKPVIVFGMFLIRVDQIYEPEHDASEVPVAAGPHIFQRVIRYPTASPPADPFADTPSGFVEIFRPDDPVSLSATGYWPGGVISRIDTPSLPDTYDYRIQVKWKNQIVSAGKASRFAATSNTNGDWHVDLVSKVGTFTAGEILTANGSATQGKMFAEVTSTRLRIRSGNSVGVSAHLDPPKVGDTLLGESSGATATISRVFSLTNWRSFVDPAKLSEASTVQLNPYDIAIGSETLGVTAVKTQGAIKAATTWTATLEDSAYTITPKGVAPWVFRTYSSIQVREDRGA